jgi:hypothetical protein
LERSPISKIEVKTAEASVTELVKKNESINLSWLGVFEGKEFLTGQTIRPILNL